VVTAEVSTSAGLHVDMHGHHRFAPGCGRRNAGNNWATSWLSTVASAARNRSRGASCPASQRATDC
jgi:hypothetical protein